MRKIIKLVDRISGAIFDVGGALLRRLDAALGRDCRDPEVVSFVRLWGRSFGWDPLGFRFEKHVIGRLLCLYFRPGQRVTRPDGSNPGTVLGIFRSGSNHFAAEVQWDAPDRHGDSIGGANLDRLVIEDAKFQHFPWWLDKQGWYGYE